MENDKKIPKRLYKYRDLSSRTLDMVVEDNVYYAAASTFNDPLDTRPTLKIDLDEAELEKILTTFVERRIKAEMDAAAKIMKASGSGTIDHIVRHSRWQANQVISSIKFEYMAAEPDHGPDSLRSLLGHEIEKELLLQYDKGIVSLAEQATCPLMWSHYGDQHRGVCIGYSTTRFARDLYKVKYGGSRSVEASKVADMIRENDVARNQVDEAVLLQKAKNWSYEQEWRLIGPRGLESSPLELEEIVFGMRCKESLKYIVMKVLEGRDREVKFYEMREIPDTFKLKKNAFSDDYGELFRHFPYRRLSGEELIEGMFEVLETPIPGPSTKVE